MIDFDSTPRRWDTAVLGPMTEAAIRARYQPPNRYRVSRFRLDPEDESSGSMLPALCVCLGGSGTYHFGDTAISLAAGDYVGLPGGGYRDEAGAEGFEVVLVFEIGLPPGQG
jgi:hypothetical protein